MATVYTRATKGSALTWAEGDANINNLNNDKIEAVVEDTTPQLGGNLDVQNYKITTSTNNTLTIEGKVDQDVEIMSLGTGEIRLTPAVNGEVVIDGVSWPTADGTANQVLKTDGAGQLSWSTISSGGISNVVEDTTPQLGGDLDVQSYNITSSGTYINITPGSTGFIKLAGLTWPDGRSIRGGNVTNIDDIREPNTLTIDDSIQYAMNTPITFYGTDVASAGLTAGQTYYIAAYVGGSSGAYEYEISTTTNGSPIAIIDFGTITNFTYSSKAFTATNGQVLTVGGGGTISWQTPSSSGLTQVSDDPSPELGGNLDVNGNSIVSLSNADINITPNGTGRVVLSGQAFPAAAVNITGTVTNVDDVREPNTLTLSNFAGIVGQAIITFTGSGVTSLGLSVGVNYKLWAPLGSGEYELALASGGGAIAITDPVTITDVNYSVTGSAATNGQLLAFNTTGLYWTNAPAAGITSVSQDFNPQLGGNLNVNGNSIVSVSNGNIAIEPNGTGMTMLNNIEYHEKIYSLGTTSGTITPNVANGNVQTITLNGNLTLSAFSSPIAGQSLTLIVNTGGTGRTLTSTMKFAGGDKTISATNTTDIISVFYDGTNYWASLSKGFA